MEKYQVRRGPGAFGKVVPIARKTMDNTIGQIHNSTLANTNMGTKEKALTFVCNAKFLEFFKCKEWLW